MIILNCGDLEDIDLYAYQQTKSYEQTRLRVVEPSNDYVSRPRRTNNVKKAKKFNSKLYYTYLMIFMSIFALYCAFVFPTVYNNLIKPFYHSVKILGINAPADMNSSMAKKGWKKSFPVDIYRLANPTVNYLSNDLFLNRPMLTKTIQKTHSEVTTMYQTSEMQDLKAQIKNLMTEYPMINPAVYVWEYENGQYVDINGDMQYPAASIIKLPVLVRLFKSIESKQMTIYDEMVLTDYYRASGSGNLQYAQEGGKYSLDALAKTMIQDSDNSATNMIISKLGGMDDINIGLRDWGISKTYLRTWLPDLSGTNKTTAKDMAKILYNLDNPGFLNINSREYIIDYMSHVKNNKLLAAGLGEGATLIHKTGDIGSMLGDAGIVYAPNGKRYIVVILARRPYNAPQGKDFIVRASNLIYKSIVD